MKAIKLTILAVLVAAVASSCTFVRFDSSKGGKKIVGSGNTVTKTIPVDAFDEIELKSFGDMDYEVVAEPYVTITGYDNIIELYSFEVKNGKLMIKTDKTYSMIQTGDVKIKLGSRGIHGVGIGGNGSFKSENLQAESFDINIAGLGNIDIKGLTGKELDVNMAGSGDIKVEGFSGGDAALNILGSGNIKISGKADEVEANILGSGDINLKNLKAKNVSSSVKGSGSVIKH